MNQASEEKQLRDSVGSSFEKRDAVNFLDQEYFSTNMSYITRFLKKEDFEATLCLQKLVIWPRKQ